MEIKKAFITGITGQDGSYLAEFLLDKGYEVHGLVRYSSVSNKARLNHLIENPNFSGRFFLHNGDLTDASGILLHLIEKIKPDEVYNLAAQGSVGVSFDMPEYTVNVGSVGVLRLLEAIRKASPQSRFFQACSSEIFGNAPVVPQKEETPIAPLSYYALAKTAAYYITKLYREAYGLHASNGIMFAHESPRRGDHFVTKIITRGVVDIMRGRKEKIVLGNLDVSRDLGYAPEYVEAMWRMLQQEKGDDYAIATGETHSLREFLAEMFKLAGIQDWEKRVEIKSQQLRPTDIKMIRGDATKAREKLGFEPKVKFRELVKILFEAECAKEGIKLV